MFAEDYRELKIENAEKIAKRCFLFEQFVDDLLAQEPAALKFRYSAGEDCDSSALSREIDHESCVHAKTGRKFARQESHSARHRMLRNGGRVRSAR